MSYCTLEEAWGPDFKKKHKKTKKEKRLEKQEKKILDETIDPQIVIHDKLADTRVELQPHVRETSNSNISGYDSASDYFTPYQRTSTNQVERTNETVLEERPRSHAIQEERHHPVNQMVQREYDSLKHNVEGFGNQTDEQFNQLILYIFTGIFYLMMLDMMYQLGKKSY